MKLKPSFYNLAAPLADGCLVLYNTLHEAMTCLEPDEAESYKRLKKGSCRETILAEELAEAGFALEDPQDEADYLTCQYERYKFNDRVLELMIMPTMECNFRCTYCYEGHKRTGAMSEKVEQAIVDFVIEQHKRRPFQSLKVTWYGGEPLLNIPCIERLSRAFIAFCGKHGIEYWAVMISNSYLADEQTAKRLAACRIISDMLTLDGVGPTHDRHRKTADGRGSYDVIMENIGHLQAAGIVAEPGCILDKSNFESCRELQDELKKRGLKLRVSQLVDHSTCNPQMADEFDEMSRAEFADAYFDLWMAAEPDAEDFEKFFAPVHIGCGAPIDRYYVIDEIGRAFKCGCEIEDDRAVFDLREDPEQRSLHRKALVERVNFNPTRIECRCCPVLPLCQGGCQHKRSRGINCCHVAKFRGKDFLRAWYETLCGGADGKGT